MRFSLALPIAGVVTLALTCLSVQSANRPELRVNEGQDDVTVIEATGLPAEILLLLKKRPLNAEQWQSLFQVFVRESDSEIPDDQPPILGRYWVSDIAISFRPRFPFRRDLGHYARLRLARLYALFEKECSDDIEWIEVSIPAEPQVPVATTTVKQVHPSRGTVPANLLRLYVHFSAPMSRRDVHKHIHLFNYFGQEVALPFVEVQEGLWDRSQQRLTLFFHPGRVKRGVGPNQTLGTPLKEGGTYHLVIDKAWKDAHGNPLAEGFQTTFTVGPEDRAVVDHGTWEVQVPVAGERTQLILRFPEPLDHALLLRMLAVQDGAGHLVKGETQAGAGETQWSFRPNAPWRVGSYKILVNTLLEDLAGNNLRGVFDREARRQREVPKTAVVKIPFAVKAEAGS